MDVDEYSKDDPRDFVLWKARASPASRRGTTAPVPGRPGLAHRVLGDGAAAARRAADRHPRRRHRSDLSASRERDRAERGRHRSEPFARFWVHVEHLFVENEKMSKSLGNVYTLPEIAGARTPAVGAALSAAVVALPQAAQLHLGRDGSGGGGASPDRRLPARGSRR